MRLVLERFHRSRLALVLVVVVAAGASIATSQPDERLDAEGASGAFLLTAEDPSAELRFTIAASEATRESGYPGPELVVRVLTLDSGIPSVVRLELDGSDLGIIEWPNAYHSCTACVGGEHAYRLEYESGVAPALVMWSLDATARFNSLELPAGAELEIDVASSGPDVPITLISGFGRPAEEGWVRSRLDVMTGAAIAEGSELWLGFLTGDDAILVEPDDRALPVVKGGAAELAVPPECLEGPCTISDDVLMAPSVAPMLILVGEADVPIESRDGSRSVVAEGSSTIVDVEVALDSREVMEFVLDIGITDVDADLVRVVQPNVSIFQARGPGERDRVSADFEGRSVVQGEQMTCVGSSCTLSLPMKVRSFNDDPTDTVVQVAVTVWYGEPVEIEAEIRRVS